MQITVHQQCSCCSLPLSQRCDFVQEQKTFNSTAFQWTEFGPSAGLRCGPESLWVSQTALLISHTAIFLVYSELPYSTTDFMHNTAIWPGLGSTKKFQLQIQLRDNNSISKKSPEYQLQFQLQLCGFQLQLQCQKWPQPWTGHFTRWNYGKFMGSYINWASEKFCKSCSVF